MMDMKGRAHKMWLHGSLLVNGSDVGASGNRRVVDLFACLY